MRIFILLSAVLLIVSCSDKREKMLCKTWQVGNVEFINEEQALVQSDTMKGNQQEIAKGILKEILMKNIYQFNDDGTYKTGNTVATAQGNWELDGESLRFISRKGNEEKEKLIPVERLTEDTLVLLMQKDQTSLNVKLVMIPVK